MSATYAANAPIATAPSRATRGSESANTPNGARTRIHRTRRSIASPTPRKNRTTGSRWSTSIERSARPNRTANTIRGSIAPSAAARMGLAGTRSVNHLVRLACAGSTPPATLEARARKAAMAPGSMRSRENAIGARMAPTDPERQRNRNATTSARVPHPRDAARVGARDPDDDERHNERNHRHADGVDEDRAKWLDVRDDSLTRCRVRAAEQETESQPGYEREEDARTEREARHAPKLPGTDDRARQKDEEGVHRGRPLVYASCI